MQKSKSQSIGKAVARFIKISPYKVRKVIALIKGKDVNSALAILESTDKRASIFLVRALKSAIASAKQTGKIKQDELYISKIIADDGPMMKRYRAAAFGRAAMIRKRTSHILIELDKIPTFKTKGQIGG
ncbi:MAG: 50S ribosomal protein L22 [Candidatus Omnitrophota bacterium]